MSLLELLIIAVSLSADAFAVSVCKGLAMKRIRWGQALMIALFFGVFQAGMPLLGYFLGVQFSKLVEPVDHWVVFILLGVIGGKMIWDGVRGEDDEAGAQEGERISVGELVLLALATSIDAFAVGCTFAFMNVDIWVAVGVIGITTFALSLVGVLLGNRFGTRYNRPATILGGVVLVLIGVKTLLEHLGVISF